MRQLVLGYVSWKTDLGYSKNTGYGCAAGHQICNPYQNQIFCFTLRSINFNKFNRFSQPILKLKAKMKRAPDIYINFQKNKGAIVNKKPEGQKRLRSQPHIRVPTFRLLYPPGVIVKYFVVLLEKKIVVFIP